MISRWPAHNAFEAQRLGVERHEAEIAGEPDQAARRPHRLSAPLM